MISPTGFTFAIITMIIHLFSDGFFLQEAWKKRNRIVFNNKPKSPPIRYYYAINHFIIFSKKYQLEPKFKHQIVINQPSPPFPCSSLNADGTSCDNPRHSGIRMITQNEFGVPLALKREYIGITTSNMAEPIVILIGLQLAHSKAISHAIIQSDSQVSSYPTLRKVLQACNEWTTHFQHIRFHKIYRQAYTTTIRLAYQVARMNIVSSCTHLPCPLINL